MKLPKNVKIEAVVSDDKTRPVLSAPYLDVRDGQGILIATNDRAMAVQPVSIDAHDAEGWVSIDAMKSARKLAARGNDAEVQCNGACTLANGQSFPRPVPPGDYPNWRSVVPSADRESVFSVTLNPELLLDLARAIGSEDRITLKFGANNLDPIAVTGTGTGTGVIMPIRQ